LPARPAHGRQGEATKNDYFPRLAGKPAAYLMNQLVAFRDGRRRYPPMNYLLEYIPDQYLQKWRTTSQLCARRQCRNRLLR
jgi:cytochrome c553